LVKFLLNDRKAGDKKMDRSAWESNPPTAFRRRYTGFEGLMAAEKDPETRMVDTSTFHRVTRFLPILTQTYSPFFGVQDFFAKDKILADTEMPPAP
jgi:hypothetical protein